MKSNPAKKTSEQCFLGKTKPTCQNSAIFEHFQKMAKKPRGHSFPRPFNWKALHIFEGVMLFNNYIFAEGQSEHW